MDIYLPLLIVSTIVSAAGVYFLHPRLKRMGMIGNDINKPDRPEVAEMGGLGIVAGVSAGILIAIFLQTFFGLTFNLQFVMASIIAIQTVAFVGLVDDLIDMPQRIKAFVPMFASIPLIVLKAAGSTMISIPFVGVFDLGLIYIFILIPLAITVCSNLTNMLAGFNGMEAGMGIVMFLTLSILAVHDGKIEMAIISISMLGALIGFYYFNKYPSKVFPGDVGNLSIGAALAAAVIVGNIESAGVILAIPYIIEFFIKAANKFPSRGWAGIYKEGKLYSPEKPVSFAQWIMRITNGVSEQNLSLIFVGIESIAAIIALALFFK